MQKLSLNKKLLNKLIKSGVTIVDPEAAYVEGEIKIGKGTKIFPNTFLDSVKIGKNCAIGPVAQIIKSKIGDNNIVGFTAQIKRSTIGKGCHFHHHCYIGDTKMGNDVNIAAGVITCNYDGKEKYKTIIGDNVFIGSNVCLIAPLIVGKGSYIAAGSTIKANTKTGKDSLIICREKDLIIKKRIK